MTSLSLSKFGNIDYVIPVTETNSDRQYLTPPIEEGWINKTLPTEIMVNILSRLDEKTLRSTLGVCHSWKGLSLDIIHREKHFPLNQIARFASNHLDPIHYSQQIHLLSNVSSENQNPLNLRELYASTPQLQKKILEILKSLDGIDLSDLKKKFKPQGENPYGNLLRLATLNKRLDALNEISPDPTEVTGDNENQIPLDVLKDIAFSYISKKFVLIGEVDKALEVAKLIRKGILRDEALLEISKGFVVRQNLVKFLEVVNMIVDDGLRGLALQPLFKLLVEQGDFDEALRIANERSDKRERVPALWEIVKGLLNFYIVDKVENSGNIDRMIEIIKTMGNEKKQSTFFYTSSQILAEKECFDEARKVANETPDDLKKEEANRRIEIQELRR